MVIDIVVLALMAKQSRHGYDIKKAIQAIMPSELRLNNNVLYPTLRRLQDEGCIEPTAAAESATSRKTYRVTAAGRRRLPELLAEFDEAAAGREDEFYVRVAFFDLLPSVQRSRIIELRTRALERRFEHAKLLEAEYGPDFDTPWVRSILKNRLDKLEADLRWVEGLSAIAGKKSGPRKATSGRKG